MAICPKCQLPNPESVAACIWCGGHQFAAVVETPANVAAVAGSSFEIPGGIIPVLPPSIGESIHTPNTPPPEHKPLPSHVGLLLTPRVGSVPAEPRTVATTPAMNYAAQQVGVPTPAPQETLPKIHPKIVVLRGQKINLEYPVYEGRNVIGRFADRPVDIDLVGQEAEGQIWSSRQHAAITFDKNILLVEDLNSLNGTWVNGSRLQAGQKRQLKADDVIQIGTVQLKIIIL